MIEGGAESMGDRREALRPSELSSDLELVQFFRDGKDAEARLAALAAPKDGEGALQTIVDRGRLAWQILFLRYRSTVRAFGLSRVRSLSIEEFESEFFDRFWSEHKARTWRGDASFRTWIRWAAGSIHFDLINEMKKLSAGDLKAFEESSAGEAARAGRRGLLGADPEDDPDDLGSDESPEDDDEFPDRAVDTSAEREAERLEASRQEPSAQVRWLTEVIAAMPPDRRLLYRLCHGLSLEEDDVRQIAGKSGMDRQQVELEVQRLYDEFQDRSDARLRRLRAHRERARIESVKTQERLRDSRRTRYQLVKAKESTRGPQPGLDASLAKAHRAVAAAVVRLRTLEARIQKLDAALREELRIESKAVARSLATSSNNVDKHLQRAREDIARAKERS